MRISDWSSDVCSSDLTWVAPRPWEADLAHILVKRKAGVADGEIKWPCGDSFQCSRTLLPAHDRSSIADPAPRRSPAACPIRVAPREDRKSVVYGKSVSVRVALGGRRTHKKKNK